MIASANINDTNHPSLSLSEDGRLLLAFQGREAAEKDGWGPVRGFLVEVSDDGAVSAPSVIPGSKKTVQFPTVVAGTVGRAFVAWTEATDKGLQVMLSRGRRGNAPATAGKEALKNKAGRAAPRRPVNAAAPVKVEHQHDR
ncbi:MAG: hypothetical protein ACREEM_11685 [Blastocatellia bacterium]